MTISALWDRGGGIDLEQHVHVPLMPDEGMRRFTDLDEKPQIHYRSDRNVVEVLAEEFVERYRTGERPPRGTRCWRTVRFRSRGGSCWSVNELNRETTGSA